MFVFAFERLETWHLSNDLVGKLYKITRGFPLEEKFGLTQQIRRAGISISSNLAEGSGRMSKKDQAHFFTMAFSSLLEVLNQLIIAHKIEYLRTEELQEVRKEIELLSKKIAALRNATLNHIP
jgi:four helix bundle protein